MSTEFLGIGLWVAAGVIGYSNLHAVQSQKGSTAALSILLNAAIIFFMVSAALRLGPK